VGLEVSQSTLDIQVLHYIKKELRFGKVYINSSALRGQGRFVIPCTTDSYIKMINYLDINDLRLIKRLNQYKI